MLNELRAQFGNTVTTGDLVAYNRDYMRRARAGELKLLSRGVWDLSGKGAKSAAGAAVVEVEKPIDAALIRKRFQVLSTLADGVVDGNIRALIVSGSAGVGKTHELDKKLKDGARSGKITSHNTIKGSISSVCMFQTLYDNREKGQVLVLDDTDKVFEDEETMNLLKAALDTSNERTISWAKASRYLDGASIPTQFDYEGQIVFITNKNPDAIIARGGKLAPHMSALLSRGIFLDLCIHDARAIMVRVEQVLAESDLAKKLKLSESEVKVIVDWMHKHIQSLRTVSIRTVIQLAGFIKTSPKEWQDLAEITLLKSTFNN